MVDGLSWYGCLLLCGDYGRLVVLVYAGAGGKRLGILDWGREK